MTTLSERLGLKQHTLGDEFRVADYAGNWGVLDDHPGIYPCLSTARPTWAAAQAGMVISETDTGLLWRWTGAAFARLAPTGRLVRQTVTSNFSTSSTTAVTAITATATVPAGDRAMVVTVECSGVYSTVGLTRLSIWRGATQLQTWLHQGRLGATAAEQPQPLYVTLNDQPAAGSQAYTLRVAAEVGFGGTSTLQASVTNPLVLSVTEV